MLSKSFNPYQISSEGLIKASANQHYKVPQGACSRSGSSA